MAGEGHGHGMICVNRPLLFTVACLVRGETVHVLEVTEHADWRRNLVEYLRYLPTPWSRALLEKLTSKLRS
jgi:hypothetical protein